MALAKASKTPQRGHFLTSRSKILPDVLGGKDIIVAAHGNSLRSIVMDLDNLSKEEVLELNIPTGVPLLCTYDAKGKITERKYL